VEVGQVYTGKVKKITGFGAFVEILPGKEGLVHISQLEHHRVARVEDVVNLNDEIQVKVLDGEPGSQIPWIQHHPGPLDCGRQANPTSSGGSRY